MSRARTQRKLAKAIKFASLRAQGYSLVEAWRQITPDWKERPQESQYKRASEFASDPVVRGKVEQVLQEANAAAMMSNARYTAKAQDLLELAVERDNLTAAMAGLRILGQTTNNLRENLTLTDDRGVTDAQLMSRIAALRPDLAPLLGQMLGMTVPPATEQPDNAANGSEQPTPAVSKPLH